MLIRLGTAFLLIVGLVATAARPEAAPATRYEEVREWPKLPAGISFGEVSGVATDKSRRVFVFHRPGRGFDLTATEKIKQPTVFEIDGETGALISSWGEDTFLVPHGITIDDVNNVF